MQPHSIEPKLVSLHVNAVLHVAAQNQSFLSVHVNGREKEWEGGGRRSDWNLASTNERGGYSSPFFCSVVMNC